MSIHAGGIHDTIPDGWYSVGQVAAHIHRDVSTVRRWKREGLLVPDGAMQAGQLTINLYSENKLDEAAQLAGTLHAGRPPKEAI